MSSSLILLPGLGANSRLFDHQALHFGERLWVPPYPAPFPNESLREYAIRWVDELGFYKNEMKSRTIWLGGASFGGMVALEVSKQLHIRNTPCAGVILISALRSREAITPRFRTQSQLLKVTPEAIVRPSLLRIGVPFFSKLENLGEDDRERLEKMVHELDYSFFKWCTLAAGDWQWTSADVPPNLQVAQLHGEYDGIIPLPDVHRSEAEILKEAKHLIFYTHAEAVNQWIERTISGARHV
jgi:pimeloyl-ACP methyl ester carboxylesterase